MIKMGDYDDDIIVKPLTAQRTNRSAAKTPVIHSTCVILISIIISFEFGWMFCAVSAYE